MKTSNSPLSWPICHRWIFLVWFTPADSDSPEPLTRHWVWLELAYHLLPYVTSPDTTLILKDYIQAAQTVNTLKKMNTFNCSSTCCLSLPRASSWSLASLRDSSCCLCASSSSWRDIFSCRSCCLCSACNRSSSSLLANSSSSNLHNGMKCIILYHAFPTTVFSEQF